MNDFRESSQLLDPELKTAIEKGQITKLENLVKKQGKSVLLPCEGTGDYPLHLAAKSENPKMIECLLNLGADFTKINDEGLTPIQIALKNEKDNSFFDWKCVLAFVNNSHDSTNKGLYYEVLAEAVLKGKLELTKTLLLAGVTSNKNSQIYAYPLHTACIKGFDQIAYELLNRTQLSLVLSDNKIQTVRTMVNLNQWKCMLLLAKKMDDSNYICREKEELDDLTYAAEKAIEQHETETAKVLMDVIIERTALSKLLHTAAYTPKSTSIIEALLKKNADISHVVSYHKTNALARDLTPIQIMADQGHWDNVIAMVKTKKDTDGKGRYGYALTLAAKLGRWDIVETLLKEGVNPNYADNAGYRPFHYAAATNQTRIIPLLLQNDADFTSLQKKDAGILYSTSPLEIAILNDNWSYVIAMAQSAQSKKTEEAKQLCGQALARAAASGKRSVVKALLDAGVSPDVKHGYVCALQDAAKNGDHEMVQLLLDKKADITVTDYQECTPIQLAAKNEHWQCVRVFLEKATDTNGKGKYSVALTIAASKNETSVVEAFIVKGIKPTAAYEKRYPLHYAADHENFGLIKLFLEKGADPKQQENSHSKRTAIEIAADKVQQSVLIKNWDCVLALIDEDNAHAGYDYALAVAVQENHIPVATRLLQAGANPNTAHFHRSRYPLHDAAEQTNLEMIKLLMDNKAKPARTDVLNWDNKTPLEIALDKEKDNNILQDWKIVKFFIQTYTDTQGTFRFHYALCEAAARNKVGITQFCLDNVVSPDRSDRDGNYPLHIAARNGHHEIVSILLQYNADITKKDTRERTPIQVAVDNAKTEGWKCVNLLVNRLLYLVTNRHDIDNFFTEENLNGLSYAINAAIKQNDQKLVSALLNALEKITVTYFNIKYESNNEQRIKAKLRDICDSAHFLHTAIQIPNSQEIISLLLEYNADPTKPDSSGKTAIELATGNVPENGWKCVLTLTGHLPTVARFNNLDKELKTIYINQLLYVLNETAKKSHPSSFLEQFQNLITVDPLLCLRMYLENLVIAYHRGLSGNNNCDDAINADLKQIYQNASYLLLSAAQNSNSSTTLAFIERLLLNDVDISVTDKDSGKTPIQIMADRGNWDGVLAMAKGKKDSNSKGQYGYALTKAAKAGRWDVVTTLLKADAKPDVTDDFGTALHYAAQKGNKQMLSLFLLKMDVNTENTAKQTALDIATQHNHKDCIEYLRTLGNDNFVTVSSMNLNDEDKDIPIAPGTAKIVAKTSITNSQFHKPSAEELLNYQQEL